MQKYWAGGFVSFVVFGMLVEIDDALRKIEVERDGVRVLLCCGPCSRDSRWKRIKRF